MGYHIGIITSRKESSPDCFVLQEAAARHQQYQEVRQAALEKLERCEVAFHDAQQVRVLLLAISLCFCLLAIRHIRNL